MKELIAIEYWEVETQVNKVIELVKVINSKTDILNKKGINLTTDDVIKMSVNINSYKQEIYLKELQNICEMFAQDFNEVSKFEFSISNSDMFHKMAMAKCNYIFELAKEIHRINYYGDSIYLNYIEIKDNIASPKLNYQEDIKEHYSHYTKNDKQAKLTKALKVLQKDIKEVMKLGFCSSQVLQFINGVNNELEYQMIENYK